MFNTKYVSEDEAKKLLQDGEISGYLKLEEGKPKVTIMTNGIDQTILKYVTEEISETIDVMQNIAEYKIQQIIKSTPRKEDIRKL